MKDFSTPFLLVIFSFVFSACSQSSPIINNEDAVTEDSVQLHQYDVNQFKMNKVVCDPLGGPGNPGPQDGLVGQLFSLEAGQPQYDDVTSYIENGVKSTQKLFFTDLNVPTRMFDTGFPTQTGSIIQNDQGEDLFEYFAIRFRSVLKLSPEDQEGYYELALLSDDGSIMTMTDVNSGIEQVVVENDHDHQTRMGCGDTVYMTYDSEFDVKIDYYQGPRYHISVIPMWRRVDQGTQAEPECGKEGNTRYFDLNNNSAPKKAYNDMLLRGWQPIASSNWSLPPMAIVNPCTQGTNAKISNFQVGDIGEGVAIVTWETDIATTSQVLWRDALGNETVTDSDNVLRLQHQVIIDEGIDFGETYSFQAIAISADMGKTLGPIVEETF